MSTINEAYSSIADVNLWLKTQANDELNLADVPSIIPLRWQYIRDNWGFIKQDLISAGADLDNSDLFYEQIKDFSKFVETERVSSSRINPLSDSNNFYKYYSIFDYLPIRNLNLTNEELKIIEIEVARISAFSKNDFIRAKQNIIAYRDRVTDIYGLNDNDYNAAFKKSSIPAQVTATIVNINYLYTLHQGVKTVDYILANLFAVDAVVDPFALARANANNPEIDIGQYASGKLVTISYGESLQGLAARYLGDPNKWIDIAIANGLKPPYIDEVGERLPLLSNGNGNQINISETDSNGKLNIDKFYINQPIFLQSSTQVTADQRAIISIRQIPVSGEIILELDGSRNLDIYEVVDSANIRVFAPNTINSSFYVLIPSTDPLDSNRREDTPWFLAKSGEDEKKAKVDIAVDPGGDILFSTNGDLKLSYGLDNAIQAIKFKMSTELGSLRRHPGYGLVNVVGSQNNNVANIRDQLVESINTQIADDPRFDRVEELSVDYLVNGATNEGVAGYIIRMSVRLAGGTKIIPISFTINNS